MAGRIDSKSTKGDTRYPIKWTLLDPEGAPAVLTAVTMKMTNTADNSVKVAAGACTFVGNVATWAPAAADVDTVGVYALQMTDTTAGKIARWPTGREHLHEIVDVI